MKRRNTVTELKAQQARVFAAPPRSARKAVEQAKCRSMMTAELNREIRAAKRSGRAA